MNPSGFVREEFPKLDPPYSGEPSMARPMEGLHDTGPTPFLTKTYELVDDLNTNHMVSWSRGNNSFVIWDSLAFSMNILPRYFKHNNFSSFVRQLNTYGFRKVDPDKWEFAHEGFLRGQRHLLRNIRRRKTSNSQPQTSQQGLESCVVEVGRFGLDAEIDRLRRDKQVLMMELVKLRQQQQSTRAYLIAMEERLSGTEMKQRQMMGFIAKAMQNPVFLQQLIQQKGRRKELEEEICKKRRRPIEQGHGDVDFGVFELGQVGEGGIGVNLGPNYGYDDISRLNDLELEKLAGEIGGLSGNEEKMEEDHVGRGDKAIDEGFWGNLLNEEIEQQIGLLGGEGEDEEDMGVLVEQIGFLGSSP